ncbi:ATP-binding protein [Kitasatospora sp. NPDC059571]|uniref:ATP-binding protein n=1 Tax=Kitasatospora sp. NPDC059571 TaxID=3346871 RepID=UPI0036CC68F4
MNGPHYHRRAALALTGDCFGTAMRFVRRTLSEWALSVDGCPTNDMVLVAAELLGNACVHTPGPTAIDLELDDSVLTVAITDVSLRPPTLRPYRPGTPGGYGLHIVERLSTRWGSYAAPGGKTVWATLDTAGRGPRPVVLAPGQEPRERS